MLHHRQLITLLAFTLLFLTACANLKKRAQEQESAGNYDEAANLYERALKSNPKDPELATGLKSARDGVLSKRLIAVRQARLAGNQEQALNLLLETVQKEQAWGHPPRAAVAFTQNEETSFAFPFVNSKVKSAIDAKFPLQAEYWHRRYSAVFQSQEIQAKYTGLELAIAKSGKESCKHFLSLQKPQHPYFGDFAKSYCAHWGEPGKDLSRENEQKLSELYQSVAISGAVSNLPAEQQLSLQNELQSALEASPWFDVHGKKKVQITLQGNYTILHQKDLVNQVHQYPAQEPYEDFETVTRSRSVPYQASESRLDPATGKLTSVMVTKYRDESYTEQQKVVRYRSVTRHYPYNAIKHTQHLELAMALNAGIGPKGFATDLSDKADREGYQHDLNVVEVGLRPVRPDLVDPVQWIKGDFQKLRAQFLEKSTAEWVSLYCTPDAGSADLASSGDRIHKCTRAKLATAPSFIGEWYEKNLGVNVQVAQELLALQK